MSSVKFGKTCFFTYFDLSDLFSFTIPCGVLQGEHVSYRSQSFFSPSYCYSILAMCDGEGMLGEGLLCFEKV